MDGPAHDTFGACRDALTAGRPHRLWSLIITIFGDLAQAPGSRISGAALGEITELIGVKPEAMRVALHRLRKDGWLESEREGRASFHHLTQYGRTQCAEASPRIYGPGPSSSIAVHLLLDTLAGDIKWLWPLSDRFYSLIPIPARHGHWVLNFVLHPVFLLELLIWAGAAWVWTRPSETPQPKR